MKINLFTQGDANSMTSWSGVPYFLSTGLEQLGIQDHRLPYIQEGMTYLKTQGFEPIVRNSGGLAVVLDAGVLNISLILSEQDKKISINEGFEIMVAFIRRLLPEVAEKIEVYEIIGSYCPGTFDLSIGGKKFAGISQRRMKNGIAVQIYLCVEGSGGARAAMIRDFYDVSLKGEETKFIYPQVNPTVMASLQELISTNITVHELNMRAQQLVRRIVNWRRNIILSHLPLPFLLLI